jgi:hypothetical protein
MFRGLLCRQHYFTLAGLLSHIAAPADDEADALIAYF